ncbi:hypothetical protein GCM10010302_05000 [Streptomyces polychromogenes]|uniref:Uncharacterized protein n=1 Tax=Streptomyces polychromogenes TaxID=67342 RepID=A0ABN0V1C4_9ACTN
MGEFNRIRLSLGRSPVLLKFPLTAEVLHIPGHTPLYGDRAVGGHCRGSRPAQLLPHPENRRGGTETGQARHTHRRQQAVTDRHTTMDRRLNDLANALEATDPHRKQLRQ